MIYTVLSDFLASFSASQFFVRRPDQILQVEDVVNQSGELEEEKGWRSSSHRANQLLTEEPECVGGVWMGGFPQAMALV